MWHLHIFPALKKEKLCQRTGIFGVKAKGYRSDASDFQAADQLVTDVIADFGKLDVLINNAGVTRDGLLMRMSEEAMGYCHEYQPEIGF
jgi:3-oxoacyl-[acyl-carrier protein] reductase